MPSEYARTAAREFSTTDPERAHAFLRRAYVENVMRIQGSRDGFRMRHTYDEAGPLSVAVLKHSMAVEHVSQPLGRLLLARVLDGHIERRTGGETVRATRGDVFLVAQPEAPYTVAWENVSLQLVSLDQAVLASVAGGTAGSEVADAPGAAGVRFTGCGPLSSNAARYCSGVLDLVTTQVVPDAGAACEPLVLDSAARSLGAALLTTFPNTAVARDDAPGTAGTATGATGAEAVVRRAVTYLEAHAHEPVDLAEVARQSRTTPRALQRAFRAQLDTSPSTYLRRLRLERAYQELAAADPARGETVTAVARRWGFGHPGRFAAACRAAYGRSPQEVLRA
ncbi:AraC family transcriptional regulator [Streptomyces diacarni]|uniref:AraC family transcriptional regulator n=1 Tax=Streptomyces diacarni TaxID=2800381 RepID=A0A367EPE4_9ACTN|nr:helix-turn-helix domain-containing protein [Streptomyces diacarni]RCG19582.1 AraC family transcriptional regulator [Streptomyces diacarni]